VTDMTARTTDRSTHRTVRFHRYGEPGDVLQLEEASVPRPWQIAAGTYRRGRAGDAAVGVWHRLTCVLDNFV
jgi:hypothetical protein